MPSSKVPTRLPTELWYTVIKYVQTFPASSFARENHIPLEPSREKHFTVWNAIFKDDEWAKKALESDLNPALVGQNLYNLYDSQDIRNSKPAYIALVVGGDITDVREILFNSLQPHTFLKSTKEVVFKDSKITLNIHDAWSWPDIIELKPKRLFSYRYKTLRSACLYWDDYSYSLYEVPASDVIGIGGIAPTLKKASFKCGIHLKKHKDQPQCFMDPKCPETLPILQEQEGIEYFHPPRQRRVGWKYVRTFW